MLFSLNVFVWMGLNSSLSVCFAQTQKNNLLSVVSGKLKSKFIELENSFDISKKTVRDDIRKVVYQNNLNRAANLLNNINSKKIAHNHKEFKVEQNNFLSRIDNYLKKLKGSDGDLTSMIKKIQSNNGSEEVQKNNKFVSKIKIAYIMMKLYLFDELTSRVKKKKIMKLKKKWLKIKNKILKDDIFFSSAEESKIVKIYLESYKPSYYFTINTDDIVLNDPSDYILGSYLSETAILENKSLKNGDGSNLWSNLKDKKNRSIDMRKEMEYKRFSGGTWFILQQEKSRSLRLNNALNMIALKLVENFDETNINKFRESVSNVFQKTFEIKFVNQNKNSNTVSDGENIFGVLKIRNSSCNVFKIPIQIRNDDIKVDIRLEDLIRKWEKEIDFGAPCNYYSRAGDKRSDDFDKNTIIHALIPTWDNIVCCKKH